MLALFKGFLLEEVFTFGHSHHSTIGKERIVSSTAVLNVLEHLLARDTFGAS